MKTYLYVLLTAHLLLQMVASHAMDESSAQLLGFKQDSVRKLSQELQEQIAAHPQIALRKKIDNLPHDMQWEVRNWRQKRIPCNLPIALVTRLCCLRRQKLEAAIHDAAYSPSGKLLAVAGIELNKTYPRANRSFIRYYQTDTMTLMKNNTICNPLKGITFNPQKDSTILLLGTDPVYSGRGYCTPGKDDYLKLEEIGQHTLLSHGQCMIGGIHESDRRLVAWHPDGHGFIYEDLLWRLQHVDLRTDDNTERPFLSIDMPGQIQALDMQQTAKALVTDQHTRAATIRNASTGEILSTLHGIVWIKKAIFCDKGRKVVITNQGDIHTLADGSVKIVFTLKIYDVDTARKIASFETKDRTDRIIAAPQSATFITSEEEPSDNKDVTEPITVWTIKKDGAEKLFTFPVTQQSTPKVLCIDAQEHRLFIAHKRGFSVFSLPTLLDVHHKLPRLTFAQEELLGAFDEAIRTTSRINANQKQWNDFRGMPQSFQDLLARYIRPQRDVIDIIRDSSKKEDGISSIFKKLYAHLAAIQEERERISRTLRKEKLLEAFERAVTMPGTIHASQEQWDIFEKLSADFQQIMLGYITKKAEAEDRMVEKQ